MDALFSTTAPFLSIAAVPLLTNYSTSLNLLFFYLTWSTLLLSHSPLKVEAIGTLAVRLLFYLLPSYGFLAFDCLAPSVSVAVKEHGEIGVANSEEHKRGAWQRVALFSTLNVLLGIAVQTAVEVLLTQVLHVRSALKITTTLPFPYGVVKDLVKVYAAREASLSIFKNPFPHFALGEDLSISTSLCSHPKALLIPSSRCYTAPLLYPPSLRPPPPLLPAPKVPQIMVSFPSINLQPSSALRLPARLPRPRLPTNLPSRHPLPPTPANLSSIHGSYR